MQLRALIMCSQCFSKPVSVLAVRSPPAQAQPAKLVTASAARHVVTPNYKRKKKKHIIDNFIVGNQLAAGKDSNHYSRGEVFNYYL